jgi:ABC-2 type transport system permease protein
MKTIFRYTLARMLGQLIGWSIAMFLIGVLVVPFYDVFVENQSLIIKLIDAYPKEMMAFFGDFGDITSPAGFLSMEYFSYLPFVLGTFAVMTGGGLIIRDEEKGRLDLVLAHPVSRTKLFWGRMSAFCVATIVILVISWLGIVLASFSTSLNLNAGELALPFLSLFAELLLFGTLALLMSFLLPAHWMASMVAGLVLVISFFLEVLSLLTDNLDRVVKFSPLHYYQSGDAINGMEIIWFVGLLIVAIIFTIVAWVLFEHRDIRVSGEGSWKFRALFFSSRKEKTIA